MTAVSTDEAARITLEAWLVTDVGVVRDHNEDSAFMEAGQGFFIVADGMGGHAAGEVASAMAVETVKNTLEGAQGEILAFKKSPSDAGRRSLVQLLQNAVLQAHQAVFQRGQAESDKAGMGTTLDVLLIAGGEAFVAHVGDSRTYLVREGRSSQITTDHTVAEVLVIEGKLTIEEAQVSPLRTILVNAIGVSADVGVEMAHVTLKRDDRMLLCSDGLHDYFPVDEEIAQRLSADKPGEALKEMVELAKTRGGHDNITGVAVHIRDLVDAVPTAMTEDSTQPVDLPTNPFADEPTQTQVTGSPIVAPALGSAPINTALPIGSNFKQTQPMRAVSGDGGDDDPAHATTLPPPVSGPLADKPVAGPVAGPVAAKVSSWETEVKTEPKGGGITEIKADKPGDKPARDEAAPKDKAKKSKGGKADKADKTDAASDKAGDKPGDAKASKDGAPATDDDATGDTGQVVAIPDKD